MNIKKIIEHILVKKTFESDEHKNNIKLEVEGKFLKDSGELRIKKLIVSHDLLKDLGMKKQTQTKEQDKSKKPKQTLRELMQEGFANINNEIKLLKNDVSSLKTDMVLVKNDIKSLKTDMVLVKNDVNSLKNDVSSLKTDMTLIKSLPTIQSEIKAQKRFKKLTMK